MNLNELVSQVSLYIKRPNDYSITQMCGLAVGGVACTISTLNSVVFNLYNQQITYPATDNIVMSDCAVQAVSTTCYYLVCCDLLGVITVVKGTDNAFALPAVPAGRVAIGAILVTTDGVTTFTSGTDNLGVAGTSAVLYDIDVGIASSFINQAQKRIERGISITRNQRQFTIADFDYMTVRADVAIVQGDDTVILPFPNYKEFQDGGISITDSTGVVYPMDKDDTVPTGVVFQQRPLKIGRIPTTETVFSPDGSPAKQFDIWPQSDASYTMNVIAYQYSPTLDGVLYQNNWLTDNAPDALIFGALLEYCSFNPDQRTGEWEKRWQDAVYTLYLSQQKEKYSGSMISTKFPIPINKRESMGIRSNRAGIMSFGYSE